MKIILLYKNHRQVLATYVCHLKGGENKNTIIMYTIFIHVFIRPKVAT